MDEEFAASRNNLNLFYTLDAILNSTSLTEAARTASLTQPAISIALKRAREQFKDELIIMVDGEREFTPLALQLRPMVRRVLREAHHTLDFTLSFDPLTDQRTIRISMPDFVEVVLLPHLLRILREAAPQVDLMALPFEYLPTSRKLEQAVDIVLQPAALIDPSFERATLYQDNLAALVSSEHPTIKEIITEREYADGVHAALFEHIELLAPKSGKFAKLLAARNVVVRTGIYAALPQLVIDTDLIVTTSSLYAQHCASTLPLLVVPLPLRPKPVEIAAQWQRHRNSDPLIAWFLTVLQAAAAAIGPYVPA